MKCSDEALQALKEKLQVPKLFCRFNHEIRSICIDRQCKSATALICRQEQCYACQEHRVCDAKNLEQLTTLIQQEKEMAIDFLLKFLRIEDNFSMRIQERSRGLMQTWKLLVFQPQFHGLIQDLYERKKNTVNLKPNVAADLNDVLKFNFKKSVKKDKSLSNELLQTYEKEAKRMEESLLKLKEQLLKRFFISEEVKIEKEVVKAQSKILQESLIIHRQQLQDQNFIFESLNYPKELQLIYRASEQGYFASKFHEACDNIPNTFTLIKTEFKKTIAGFTPLAWKSLENPEKVTDSSKSTFLLSIDFKQKMTLNDPERAIIYSSNHGPWFGDIKISDQCDIFNSSYANFPKSFNCNKIYKYNQQAWTAFCGAPQGNYFKVVQYQVYRVIW